MQHDYSAFSPKMTALPPARKRFAQPWSVAEGAVTLKKFSRKAAKAQRKEGER